ncbi:MAG: 3-hydroxyacyl-CoA dehydrogenase [Hyphomicrobiales bacterium]|nr:3-hydroxyacyl-CoA dehydrogenase [Hyphomicrobiales bacterium]
MKIENSVAIVTGGASGLGEATMRNFVAGGAKVAVFDLNEERGNKLVEELGEDVRFYKVDVVSEESVSTAIDDVVGHFGRVDICVNCAGIAFGIKTMGRDGPHSLSAFKKVLDINVTGTFNVFRLAAEKMTANEPNDESERGVIINTASVAAYEGQKGQVAYSASKGAIAAMTLPVARDLAFYGIRICTIAPGLFLTPLFEGLGKEVCDALAKDVPFPHRLGAPSEYGDMARKIVETPYLNGETIRLDGAIRLA